MLSCILPGICKKKEVEQEPLMEKSTSNSDMQLPNMSVRMSISNNTHLS